MNKKFLYLGLLPFLLSSCGVDKSPLTIDEAKDIIANFSSVTHATYNVMGTSHCVGVDNGTDMVVTDDEDKEDFTYKEVENPDLSIEDNDDISKSIFMCVPLHLTSSNFYKELDGALVLNDCTFGMIAASVTYYGETTSEVLIDKTSDGGLKFYVFNSFMEVDIAHYDLITDALNAYTFRGRGNAHFVYDSDGFLVEEQLESINYSEAGYKGDISQCYFHAEYIYA